MSRPREVSWNNRPLSKKFKSVGCCKCKNAKRKCEYNEEQLPTELDYFSRNLNGRRCDYCESLVQAHIRNGIISGDSFEWRCGQYPPYLGPPGRDAGSQLQQPQNLQPVQPQHQSQQVYQPLNTGWVDISNNNPPSNSLPVQGQVRPFQLSNPTAPKALPQTGLFPDMTANMTNSMATPPNPYPFVPAPAQMVQQPQHNPITEQQVHANLIDQSGYVNNIFDNQAVFSFSGTNLNLVANDTRSLTGNSRRHSPHGENLLAGSGQGLVLDQLAVGTNANWGASCGSHVSGQDPRASAMPQLPPVGPENKKRRLGEPLSSPAPNNAGLNRESTVNGVGYNNDVRARPAEEMAFDQQTLSSDGSLRDAQHSPVIHRIGSRDFTALSCIDDQGAADVLSERLRSVGERVISIRSRVFSLAMSCDDYNNHLRFVGILLKFVDGYDTFTLGQTHSGTEKYDLMNRGSHRMVTSLLEMTQVLVDTGDYVRSESKSRERGFSLATDSENRFRSAAQTDPQRGRRSQETGNRKTSRPTTRETLPRRKKYDDWDAKYLHYDCPPDDSGNNSVHLVTYHWLDCEEQFDIMTQQMIHDGRWGRHVRIENNYGETPTDIAVQQGLKDIVNILIQTFDAPPDGPEDSKTTPLYQAVKHGHVEIVIALKEVHNANPHKKGKADKQSAYELAETRQDIHPRIKKVLGCPSTTVYDNSTLPKQNSFLRATTYGRNKN